MRHSLIASALILAAVSPALARDRNYVPDATPSGEPRNCINSFQIRESRVRNDQVIDFVMRGGQVYRQTLDLSCPRLGLEKRFAYETTIAQLCSSDIITVLYSTPSLERGASCGLSKFQPVTLADRAR